jgi:hypothetical protein
MPEKEIGCRHGISVARSAHRLVARVPHRTVALVRHGHGWEGSIASRIGEDRRVCVVAIYVVHGDTAQAGRAPQSRRGEGVSRRITPWGEVICGPPGAFFAWSKRR